MNNSRNTVLAATLLAALASPAFAEGSYPRIVGAADDYRVDYGPGPVGNVLGGGGVRISNEGEGRIAVSHENPAFAQVRRDGRVPVMLGGEDDRSVTWVAPAPSRAAARPQG
jgi:uncharacterized protein (DUF736 family)